MECVAPPARNECTNNIDRRPSVCFDCNKSTPRIYTSTVAPKYIVAVVRTINIPFYYVPLFIVNTPIKLANQILPGGRSGCQTEENGHFFTSDNFLVSQEARQLNFISHLYKQLGSFLVRDQRTHEGFADEVGTFVDVGSHRAHEGFIDDAETLPRRWR